jgi:cell fate regulator YaaT (PSP1 superfamily)
MNIDLNICKPAETLEAQMEHIGLELEEATIALAKFRNEPNAKNRAEILFELLDVMNAAQTAICAEFRESEINAGVAYTNSKSYVRHYLLDMSDLEAEK